MTDDFRLTSRAKAWIHGLREMYGGQPLAAGAPSAPAESAFKIL
jgi:hypothetical protein